MKTTTIAAKQTKTLKLRKLEKKIWTKHELRFAFILLVVQILKLLSLYCLSFCCCCIPQSTDKLISYKIKLISCILMRCVTTSDYLINIFVYIMWVESLRVCHKKGGYFSKKKLSLQHCFFRNTVIILTQAPVCCDEERYERQKKTTIKPSRKGHGTYMTYF